VEAVQGGRALKRKARFGPRELAGLTTVAVSVATFLVLFVAGAFASGNAGYTTFNPATGGCLEPSSNGVNCNNYADKDSVYLNGGPSSGAGLNDGNYYFAVVVPGFQNDGWLDGNDGNLSDPTKSHDSKSNPSILGDGGGDAASNRTFTVSGGKITSYGGSHFQCDSNTDSQAGPPASCTSDGSTPRNQGLLIQVKPFDDTTNAGGVYILAICKVGATSPSDCKFDAFRINSTTTNTAFDLTASKDAHPSFTRTYHWSVVKTRTSNSPVQTTATTATVNYKVEATWSGPVDTGWAVAGDITVFNSNPSAVSVSLADEIDKAAATPDTKATCHVFKAGTTTFDSSNYAGATESAGASGSTIFPYRCSYSDAPEASSETNVATISWAQQTLDNGVLPAGSTPATAAVNWGTTAPTVNNACTTVTDTLGVSTVTLGTVCQDGVTTSNVYSASSPLSNFVGPNYTAGTQTWTFTYTRTLAVVRNTCTTYTNTAQVTDTDTTGNSSQASVDVCGPGNTGALTMGFWKTTNGQFLVTNYCKPGGKTSLADWLSGVIGGPFAGASSYSASSCSSLYTNYILPIFTGANASVMTTMLKAQMLATALDVYFSTPALGWSSPPSGSKTKYPSSFLPNTGLGAWKMDLTAVCPMVDNLSTGTATCKNNTPSTDAVAAKAFPSSPMAMLDILKYASGAFGEIGGWYSVEATAAGLPLKTEQEVAKNVFDQFNNQLAFGSF
jgi:hypothetical protein